MDQRRTAELLAEADGVGFGPVWDELWGQLCHQGTVTEASYEALPMLTSAAARHRPAGYVAALHLAAGIVASIDGPLDPDVVRRRYAREIAVLRDLAERNLGLAESDVEFVYGLQALMAFENGGVWQRHLESIADGELALQCPACAEDLLLSLDSHLLGTHGDDVPTPVEPASGQSTRLRTLVDNRPDVARQLPYLEGRAVCPSCAHPFSVPTALT